MKRQYFQVKMEPEHHIVLKIRAKQLGISIGELVENLVSYLELRLRKAYEVIGIPKGDVENVLLKDELLMRILLRDPESMNEDRLKAEWEGTKTTMSTTTAAADFEASITV